MAADVIIVGGGTAGLGAARAARTVGASPVLVTDGPIGGDCTLTGCIPSKTLNDASRRGMRFADAKERLQATGAHVAATESADVLRGEGIDVIEGRATLTGDGRVSVAGRSFAGERIVIATGARASIPPIPGLSDVGYLTNESLFELDRLPKRLAIIGAGPLGSEMALAFANFGTAVTLVEARDRVLPNEESEASAVIARAMNRAGVRVLVGSGVSSVASTTSGQSLSVGDTTVEVDEVLVATGRRPNTEGLGLEAAGIELGSVGEIVVDDRLRTSVAGVSAAGDVTGLLPFTHAADEQARMAVHHALGKGVRWRYDASSTPWATFTSPEVARVGVLESEAPRGAMVAHLPLAHVDRAITDDRVDGFVKLIAAPKRLTRGLFGGRLVGATIVAERAGEMIHAPTMALRLGMFVGRLAQVTTPYPTWSTAVQQAAGQFFQPVSGLRARPAERTR